MGGDAGQSALDNICLEAFMLRFYVIFQYWTSAETTTRPALDNRPRYYRGSPAASRAVSPIRILGGLLLSEGDAALSNVQDLDVDGKTCFCCRLSGVSPAYEPDYLDADDEQLG